MPDFGFLLSIGLNSILANNLVVEALAEDTLSLRELVTQIKEMVAWLHIVHALVLEVLSIHS